VPEKKKIKKEGTLDESKSKKRKLMMVLGEGEIIAPKCSIELPSTIKLRLIDDWQQMNNKYLVSLPRKPDVSEILVSYQTQASSTMDSPQRSSLIEILSQIKEYFDKALGTILLYRFERHQYSEILKTYPNKSLTEIYGVEHLLRLLVKFPQLLSGVVMQDEVLMTVKSTVGDILKYIASNLATLPAIYEPATPQYVRLAT